MDLSSTNKITVRRGLREYELSTSGRGRDDRLRFATVAHAEMFLRGFHGHAGSMVVFRHLLCGRVGRDHCRAWTDQEVVEELARWLGHGKLAVAARRLPVMDSVTPVEEPKPVKVPFAPRVKPVPRPEPVPAPRPPSPDPARQVETLKAAAEHGVPVCEECTSKDEKPAPPLPGPDLKKQAETLKKAAEEGTPFCEECARKQATANEKNRGAGGQA